MKKLLVLIIIGIVSVFTTYSIHLDYPLVYHSDEWDHLTLVNELIEKGNVESIRAYNPYTGEVNNPDWELDYHVLLAVLIDITGIDLIDFGIIFPTIVAFLLALNTYVLVNYIRKDYLSGIIAGIFVLTIKSNVTFFGPWFLVPLSYGMSQMPLLLLIFLRAIKFGNKFSFWDISFALVFLNTTLSYPPSTIILIPIFIVYLLFNYSLLWSNRFKIILLIVLLALGLFIFIPIKEALDPSRFIYIVIEKLSFGPEDPTGYTLIVYYPRYLGMLNIALVLIGIYVTLSSKGYEQKILPIMLLVLLPLVVQFYTTQEIYLSPYRRVFMFNTEILLILAGIGLGSILHFFMRITEKQVKLYSLQRIGTQKSDVSTFGKIMRVIVLVIVLSIVVNQVNSTFFYKDKLYRIIEKKDVSPIKWLNENTEQNITVLAMPHVAKAITPISNRKVLTTVRTRLESLDTNRDEVIRDAEYFFYAGCNGKKDILQKYSPDYIFSQSSIDCSFLKEVHKENGDYIYKVVL